MSREMLYMGTHQNRIIKAFKSSGNDPMECHPLRRFLFGLVWTITELCTSHDWKIGFWLAKKFLYVIVTLHCRHNLDIYSSINVYFSQIYNKEDEKLR